MKGRRENDSARDFMSMTSNLFQVYRLRAVAPKKLGDISAFFLKRISRRARNAGPADSTPSVIPFGGSAGVFYDINPE
jgi:hypothetical protein